MSVLSDIPQLMNGRAKTWNEAWLTPNPMIFPWSWVGTSQICYRRKDIKDRKSSLSLPGLRIYSFTFHFHRSIVIRVRLEREDNTSSLLLSGHGILRAQVKSCGIMLICQTQLGVDTIPILSWAGKFLYLLRPWSFIYKMGLMIRFTPSDGKD